MIRDARLVWKLLPVRFERFTFVMAVYLAMPVIGITCLVIYAMFGEIAGRGDGGMGIGSFFGLYFLLLGMLMIVMNSLNSDVPYLVQVSPKRRNLYRGIVFIYAASLIVFYLVLILLLYLCHAIFPVGPGFSQQMLLNSFSGAVMLSLYIAFSYKKQILSLFFLMLTIATMNGLFTVPTEWISFLVGGSETIGVPMPGAVLFAVLSVIVNTVLFTLYLKVTYRMSFSPRMYDTLK